MDGPYLNTDRELWREEEKGELSAASIHVTQSGGIGINVGGRVVVMDVRRWMKAGLLMLAHEELEPYRTSNEARDQFNLPTTLTS